MWLSSVKSLVVRYQVVLPLLSAFAQIRPVIAFDFEVARTYGVAVTGDGICSVVAFVVDGDKDDEGSGIAVDVLFAGKEKASARTVVDRACRSICREC